MSDSTGQEDLFGSGPKTSVRPEMVDISGCSLTHAQLADGTPGFRLNIPDADIGYFPNWLSASASADYFRRLRDTLLWQQSDIYLFDRWVKIPRLNAWYGDPDSRYQYSGKVFDPNPWTPELTELKSKLAQAGMAFNSVLANCYRDGSDSVSWHSDDEPELGVRPLIASLSLGAPRRFHLKAKVAKDQPTVRLTLQPGSLLLMAGNSQSHWQHQIPKTQKPVTERINLTFRRITA